MIANIRGVIRLISFFCISLLTVISVAVGKVFINFFSRRWSIRWKNKIIRLWARVMRKVLNLKINVNGTLVNAPFLLVCNHLSYIDVIPLWLCTAGTFIAKSEIKSWPLLGWGTRILGVIFIDRNIKRDVQRVNKLIESAITKDQGVIIFPEGTSTKGEEVKPFHASLLAYPAEADIPVSYASITYKSYDLKRPASNYICWWGDMPFFAHFWELLKLRGFEATISFGEQKIVHNDRKVLASRLQKAVEADFEPVISSQKKPHRQSITYE